MSDRAAMVVALAAAVGAWWGVGPSPGVAIVVVAAAFVVWRPWLLPVGVLMNEVRKPEAERDAEAEMLRTRKPVVSNVFFGPLVKKHVVSVVVPVLKDEQVVYGLAIGIATDNFAKFLEHEQHTPGRLAAIVDRRNVFVARSQKHGEFTGTEHSVWMQLEFLLGSHAAHKF